MSTPEPTEVDVLVIGAGLSGIDAAYRLQTDCPGKTFAILEGRTALGGTWDLFRYPGIRSDSDMFTLGYPFRPWERPNAIAEGAEILTYLQDTAREFGIDRRIRYDRHVTSASWSSATASWTVTAAGADTTHTYTCRFLYVCTGYYSYAAGHTPDFPGRDRFRGTVIHPQHWPEDLDCSGKRVVVIGSGATAVTLVPALAHTAAHVTMVQRSPTYVSVAPAADPMMRALNPILSKRQLANAVRWRNLLLGTIFYQFTRRCPDHARALLRKVTERQLAGSSVPADPHFTPAYAPWDQRVCLAPEGDLFRALSSERASIVTDRIASFTESGIALESGGHVDADIVVTATGLRVVAAGDIDVTVDGASVALRDTFAYRGVMYSGLPNFGWCLGYTNASWTLRADLSSRYMCRVINHLDATGHDFAVPVLGEHRPVPRPLLGLTSGYVRRAEQVLPKQSDRAPWLMRQNYLLDGLEFGHRTRAPMPA
ncbi:FAD-containing monooxygenase EthA [Nocardia nova SH22a]|uniref:FAD-containing monooxygenase EthA n=1 Tax=Nocardia nova SH22a TaxID=1415166 RepID=W5TKU0_9NOCA|nr:NAD(P)/FAD-dependent oxidoreductase [Nocardia nova]AHH19965.1 FAD-containing monooxygenase EthA [Nocardia nova SH22a]